MVKMGKKRRKEDKVIPAEESAKRSVGNSPAYLVDPYHPGRPYNLTIAVAGTVLDNAVSPQRKAYLAGQIARAIAIFNVDEILVFNDKGSLSESHGCSYLPLLLNYLECPQYLKKHIFQLETDLQFAGLIPPLCLPHHFSKEDVTIYRLRITWSNFSAIAGWVFRNTISMCFCFRDGVTTNQRGYVDVGLAKKALCDIELSEGIRVTVKLLTPESLKNAGKLRGEIVPPTLPRKATGMYWGYTVIKVNSIVEVLEQKKYDCIVGTSDKGSPVTDIEFLNNGKKFENILVVFGGVDGLESAVGFENDSDAVFRTRFTHYLNVRPSQGTKTIRTEEAIPLTLGALEPLLRSTLQKLYRT